MSDEAGAAHFSGFLFEVGIYVTFKVYLSILLLKKRNLYLLFIIFFYHFVVRFFWKS